MQPVSVRFQHTSEVELREVRASTDEPHFVDCRVQSFWTTLYALKKKKKNGV